MATSPTPKLRITGLLGWLAFLAISLVVLAWQQRTMAPHAARYVGTWFREDSVLIFVFSLLDKFTQGHRITVRYVALSIVLAMAFFAVGTTMEERF